MWKYANAMRSSVTRELESGAVLALPANHPEVLAWVGAGNTIAEPDAPQNSILDAQIDALEGSVTPRRMREAALTEDGRSWLATIDARICDLRKQRS